MRTTRFPVKSIAAVVLLGVGAIADGCRSASQDEVIAAAAATTGAVAATTEAPVASDYTVYDLPSVWRDQRGDTIALRMLAGRVQVVAMVYTNCTVTCPLVMGALKRIEGSIPEAQRGRVGFVLVSLDPQRDTPGRLAEWAEQNRLDPNRWTLLSGSDDAVREFAATLDVRYQRQPDGEVAHTNGITVLDRTGALAHRQLSLEGTDKTSRAVRALLQ
jgi:protein SCO1